MSLRSRKQVKLSLKAVPANNITFGLWLFAGLLPWIAFIGGLTQATTSTSLPG